MIHYQVRDSHAIGGIGHLCGDKKWKILPRWGQQTCCVDTEQSVRVDCMRCLYKVYGRYLEGEIGLIQALFHNLEEFKANSRY